jgi:DNA-binding CsgD family transcriptional regulator
MKIKSRFTKIAVASGLIVASGAAVLGITGFASAQVAQYSNVVAVAQAADTTPAAETAVNKTAVDPITDAAAAPSAVKADRPSPLAAVAKVLSMTEAELKAELKAGKSVADIAKAKNIDLATVKAALITEATAHIDAEVAAGKHTVAEGAAKLAEMTSRIDTMLTTAGLPARGPHGKGGKGGPSRFMTATLATTLKLTQEELKTQLHSGKSLADVAKTQNVDIADVKTALTSDFSAHLAEEVTSGEHTQAEADAKIAKFKTNLDTMVNRVGPAGGMKGEGRGPGGHGPMGHDAPAAQGTSASA